MTALTNNAIYAAISVTCQVGVALVLAAVLEARVFPNFSANLFRTALFLPSILPVAFCLFSFRFPAGSLVVTALAAHIVNTG